jgi:hypothetical protein
MARRGEAVGEPAECRTGHFRDTGFRRISQRID